MEIKGIAVTLYTTAQNGVDEFNNPVEVETAVTVNNVLVGEPSADDIVNSTELYGKKIVYTLAIPKGDANNWENKKVAFFGATFHTFGSVTQGIESMIPGSWNKKVKVEKYG